ncbi:hypothetical protein ACFL6S_19115 [Candidatus Poribacteria bacterium]
MYTKLCRKLNSESGMALLVAMFITFLSSIMITFYMGSVIQESKHSVWQKERAQSLFLAEAGIQKGIYFLNKPDDPDNPWAAYVDREKEVLLVSENQIPVYNGTDIDDPADRYKENYRISLHDRFVDENGAIVALPPRFFLIKSTGTIKRSIPIKRSVSAIVSIIGGIPVPGALSIYDDTDLEDELIQFESSQWVVSGVDIDDPLGKTGVAGVAIANTGDGVTGEEGQFGQRLDQVEGVDGNNIQSVGDSSIIEDPTLPKDLEELVGYFGPMSQDISGTTRVDGSYLGALNSFQILRADLSKGDVTIPGNRTGYGVLILEGDGAFNISGGSEWYGLILCHGNIDVHLRGGGESAAHIYGALMIDDGTVTMNGTADIRYSSEALRGIRKQLVAYQVYAWCGGWGKPLGRFEVASAW